MQRVFERKVDIYTESVRFGRWGFLRDVGTAAVTSPGSKKRHEHETPLVLRYFIFTGP